MKSVFCKRTTGNALLHPAFKFGTADGINTTNDMAAFQANNFLEHIAN
jgi:hypothetical protein